MQTANYETLAKLKSLDIGGKYFVFLTDIVVTLAQYNCPFLYQREKSAVILHVCDRPRSSKGCKLKFPPCVLFAAERRQFVVYLCLLIKKFILRL